VIIITQYKTKTLPAVCPYVCLDLYNYLTDFDAVFLVDRVIQKEVLFVNKYRYTIVEKRFGIFIVPARSRGGSLVKYKLK
jgi:hypothetical protein